MIELGVVLAWQSNATTKAAVSLGIRFESAWTASKPCRKHQHLRGGKVLKLPAQTKTSCVHAGVQDK